MNFTPTILPNWLRRRARAGLGRAVSDGGEPTIGSSGKKQILVDVSILYRDQGHSGIQRVVRNLWAQLSQGLDDGVEVRAIFATRSHGYGYAPSNFLDHQLDPDRSSWQPVAMHSGDVFLGLDFCPSLLPRYESSLAAWRAAGASVYLLVYDLLPLQNRRWFNGKTIRNYRRWIGVLERQCDHAICISNSVATELHSWLLNRLGGQADALPLISKIRLGADISRQAAAEAPTEAVAKLLAHAGTMQIVLMVGTVERRKGYDKVLKAFEQLWTDADDRHCLIIAGRGGWKTRRLQSKLRRSREAGTRLFWIDNATDADLGLLYSRSDGFLFASYGEGYGLPVVEAMSHGCRVLARDLPVLREVAGANSASFFTDDSPISLAASIRQWLENKSPSLSTPSFDNWSDAGKDLKAILYNKHDR